MKEIKFRGNRLGNDELVYGSYVYDVFHKTHLIFDLTTINMFWNEVKPETVEQFTGRKDKDGKDEYKRII